MTEWMNERTNEWMKWTKWMKWMKWNEGINDWMNWNQGIETKRMNWNFADVIFKWKSSSRYSPVRFLSTTFPDQAAKPRKQRPSFGDHGAHLTRKNAGFRARERFQAWIHAFPISHTSQLLAWWCCCHDDWGDDVVAIMVRKLAMTIVCNSEVS